MSNAARVNADAKSQVPVWALVVGMFAIASCAQILFYGAPALLRFGSYDLPSALRLPAGLLFFFGPAAIATLFSIRLLRSAAHDSQRNVRAWAIVAVLLLAILSALVGVFFSLNAWGT